MTSHRLRCFNAYDERQCRCKVTGELRSF